MINKNENDELQEADEFEEAEEEADPPIEARVRYLESRLVDLERQVQTVVEVVKPYDRVWYRDTDWAGVARGLGIVALVIAIQLAVFLIPGAAFPFLVMVTVAGVAVILWFLISITSRLSTRAPERRRSAYGDIAFAIVAIGIGGLLPPSGEWVMPLWVALILVCTGGAGIFFFREKA
ncbi:MAG: hypothetical protein SGJ21_13190 [Alphaproteobacteria bacterium]|nr:hypothetical protein [Alphaproteobacteria bacterium]